MAVRILTTNGTWTTGTWYEAEAYALDCATNTNAQDALNTERTRTVTFASAGNQQGIALMLYCSSPTLAGTLTIKLQEQTAPGVWTDRTTDVFISGTDYSPTYVWSMYYFPLTTYAVDTTADKWRYAVSNSSTYVSWSRSSTAGAYTYAVALDTDTAKPSNGDTIILGDDITYTVDADQTWSATSNRACVMCKGASITWANPPAASYTLTLNGAILRSYSGNITIGSEANPISAANKAVIDMSSATYAYMTDYWAGYFYGNATDFYVAIWGAESDDIRTKIAANAASGQADIVTEDDMSAIWSVGDNVTLYGKNKTGADTVTYTISNIVGTTITLSSNLDFQLLAEGAIVNLDERDNLGVWIKGTAAGCYFNGAGGYHNYVDIVGCYMENLYMLHYLNTVTTKAGLGRSILLNRVGNAVCAYYPVWYGTDTTYVGTYSNIHQYSNYAPYSASIYFVVYGATISNITAKNAYVSNGFIGFQGTSQIVSDVIGAGGLGSSGYGNIYIVGAGGTYSDIHGFGGAYTINLTSCYNATFEDCEAQSSGAYALYLNINVIGVKFTNCDFGGVAVSGTADIYAVSSYLTTAIFNNCAVGAKATYALSNISNAVTGSYLKFQTFDETANDHRVWYPYGETISTGDGLTDTTVHTSGTGKFAIKLTPTSATGATLFDDWEFDVPTGDIQNKTMTVAVWVKINNAAYYAGTHQLPRLNINYDDGTTAYAQAAETTDWQQLFVTFTPTTTYGQITVTISGKTDATTTSRDFYVDDFAVLYPAGVTLDLGGLDNWADALPVTPPVAIPISAYTVSNAVWEELQSSHTTSGSMGSLFKKALTFIKSLL